jgi:hypothetical protein
MRPHTLAEAIDRIRAGEPQDFALAEFVDHFLGSAGTEERYAALEQEPARTNDEHLDALAGAIAEYLAKQYKLGCVPGWASAPWRSLSEPWFTAASATPAMREYLTWASPAEFRSRNIFTEERPLRRARIQIP